MLARKCDCCGYRLADLIDGACGVCNNSKRKKDIKKMDEDDLKGIAKADALIEIADVALMQAARALRLIGEARRANHACELAAGSERLRRDLLKIDCP